MTPLLQTGGLSKSYNRPVLVDFDFELKAGEVHALMGSNGAGKSTLARVLCGLTPRDAGTIRFGNEDFAPTSRGEAAAAGMVMVMQELNLIPTLSVAENLSFTQLPHRFGILSRARIRERATTALERVHLSRIDPDRQTGSLGIGQQQLLEIAIALDQQCRVLILDEPTAALTDPEIETLFEQIARLRKAGVGILYVSHRMEEIRRIADRVTTMRDGRHIATHSVRAVTVNQIVKEMSGHEVTLEATPRERANDAPVVLEVRQLAIPPLLQNVNLELRRGEILGLAGLVGSGRTELLRAIYGADQGHSGEVRLHGNPVKFHHPADSVAAGIGMVPEDRKSDALLLSKDIRTNASLSVLPRFARASRILREEEQAAVAAGCARLAVHCDSIDQPVGELSGGNQQKVVLTRWLLHDCEILLLDEPTRGIDIAAKEMFYKVLRDLASAGKSLLVVSSELTELMLLCDRIAVLSGGVISREFTPPEWSHEALTEAAFKVHLSPT